MKTKILHMLDFFFVLRPTLFFPVWTVALAGAWAQKRYAAEETFVNSLFPFETVDFRFILYLFLLTCIMGASFLLNQITDVESDRLNNKLYLIASGAVSVRQAYMEIGILLILPLIVLFWLNWPLAIVAASAFIITGWGYSGKPFMLENKPWGGLLTNIFGALTIFCYGWLLGGQPEVQMLVRSVPYLLGILAVYLLTTIPDIPGDAAAKKITIAVYLGAPRVITFALIAHVAAIASAILLRDIVVLLPALLVLPFFYRTFHSKSISDALQTNKFAALFLSLMMCVRFPLYLPVLVIVFFFSKWYYAQRFHISYPSLRL